VLQSTPFWLPITHECSRAHRVVLEWEGQFRFVACLKQVFTLRKICRVEILTSDRLRVYKKVVGLNSVASTVRAGASSTESTMILPEGQNQVPVCDESVTATTSQASSTELKREVLAPTHRTLTQKVGFILAG
jgi:hypothetical protein